MVLDKIAEFLRHLLERHDTMSVSLATILTKLDEQGQQLATQGAQIDKLISDRDAKKQADLQRISDLLDTNAAASKANADKVAGALAPDASVEQPAVTQAVDLDPATGLPRA